MDTGRHRMMPSWRAGRRIIVGKKSLRGVTFVELMIVIVIIGIMASIAYPQYREFVARAKRAEAKAALLKLAQNQERFYLTNSTFTKDMTKLGFSGDSGVITDSGTYSVSVTAADASNFTAVATYRNDDDEKNKCLTFSITGADLRESTPDTNCWTRTR